MRKTYAISSFSVCLAAIQFGTPFSDNAVLQRDMHVPIWGKASPGETVKVEVAGQSLAAKAGDDGKWRVDLAPMEASSEGRALKIGDVEVKDVLVGEVWFASGQSNMEMGGGYRVRPGCHRYAKQSSAELIAEGAIS